MNSRSAARDTNANREITALRPVSVAPPMTKTMTHQALMRAVKLSRTGFALWARIHNRRTKAITLASNRMPARDTKMIRHSLRTLIGLKARAQPVASGSGTTSWTHLAAALLDFQTPPNRAAGLEETPLWA